MTTAEERMPWYEDGNCIMCGFSHRYQWPNGSDLDRHQANYVACINSLVPELAEALAERDQLREALARIAGATEVTGNFIALMMVQVARAALSGKEPE